MRSYVIVMCITDVYKVTALGACVYSYGVRIPCV